MAQVAQVQVDVDGGKGTIIAPARTFKTGSRGFYGQAKVMGTDGRRYQVSVTVVEIGSKPE
jgi:hypothetical protein